MRALLLLVSLAFTAGGRCTWTPDDGAPSDPAVADGMSYNIEGGAWDCSRPSPSGAPLLPALSSISCLQGRRLHVVGDSISRTMLFDFVAALHKCEEQPQQHAATCEFASAARSKRGDYDLVLPWHLLDGSSSSNESPSDVRIAFRTVTVARNISAAPWFHSTFFDDEGAADASKDDLVLFNVGLWNLRYDNPRADVPHGYLRELQQLAAEISAVRTTAAGSGPALPSRLRRLFWRPTTPIEPAGNVDFPSDYTPGLIRRANEGAWPILRDVAGAAGMVDVTHRTQALPSPVDGNAPLLTVDGTHFEPWLNAVMMSDVLAGICALETRLLHASERKTDGTGGVGGGEAVAPSISAAAEGEASPAPSPAAGAATGGDASPSHSPAPSGAAAPASVTVSIKPSPAAVAVLTPAPAGFLPVVSICGGLAAAAVAMHRSRLRTAARSNAGIACTLAFVWLLVSSIERWGAIPIVGKERGVGMDMLWAVFGLAVVVGRLTVVRSAPEQQRRPAAPRTSDAAKSGASAGASEQAPSTDAASAAGDSVSPSQQPTAEAAAGDVASPSGSVSVAIPIASTAEAATVDSASGGGGALRNRDGAGDGSAAAAEQEQVSLLRDASADAEADDAESVGNRSAAAKAALSPSATASSADAGTNSGAATSPKATAAVASGGTGQSLSSSCRTGAGAASDGVPTFLSLDVCNELKGLCMVCFLLYHYWDVKAVYNPIRVMVAVFLFLTGYGNFLSLSASSQPPKLHKLCLSFIRINLLAAVLMTAVRAPWMLYYICPLHTCVPVLFA